MNIIFFKKKRKPPPQDPQEIISSSVSYEDLKAGLSAYATKPTRAACLRMHFVHRARFLQSKNHTLGSVSERLQNNLCIISGKPVNPGQIMDDKHFDETLQKLCDDLKENKFWDDLIPEKIKEEIPPNPINIIEDLDRVCQLRDFPIIRSGDGFGLEKKKFAYLTPEKFDAGLLSLETKWPSLKKKVEEARRYM